MDNGGWGGDGGNFEVEKVIIDPFIVCMTSLNNMLSVVLDGWWIL